MSDKNLVKIYFHLDPNEWHGSASETVWAEKVGDQIYRIRSIPFYIFDISFEDIVSAQHNDQHGLLEFQSKIENSGNSTYRVMASESANPDDLALAIKELESFGVGYERGHDKLLALDVPASSDLYKVYDILEKYLRSGLWDFEEAHVGHDIQSI